MEGFLNLIRLFWGSVSILGTPKLFGDLRTSCIMATMGVKEILCFGGRVIAFIDVDFNVFVVRNIAIENGP